MNNNESVLDTDPELADVSSLSPAEAIAAGVRSEPRMRVIPGELLIAGGDIELNAGRASFALTVANTGDRPIQVGSHYHFFETNDALQFERARARGYRLNIAAGTAVRFEPGQTRRVELVALAGDRRVYGFAGRVMGRLGAPDAGRVSAASPCPPATVEDVKSAGERDEAAYTRPTLQP